MFIKLDVEYCTFFCQERILLETLQDILFFYQLLGALKEKIERYKPLKELNVPQARILLVGQVGAGKTSFFNTINSVFRGYITRQACSGNAEHSLTTVVSIK